MSDFKDVIIKNLYKQRESLICGNSELKYHFVDIYCPELKTTIPFLPIRCFRDFHIYSPGGTQTGCDLLAGSRYESIPIGNEIVENDITLFLSSGSTNAIRARHSFSNSALNLLAKNSCNGFQSFLNRHNLNNAVVISLVPPPALWPNSSLAAMIQIFEKNGFCIKWSNTENFLNIIESFPERTNIVVFGTTFHHLFLIQHFRDRKEIVKKNKILKKYHISVIDTGGTKGKTQAFTLNEIKDIFREFYLNSKSKTNSFRRIQNGKSQNNEEILAENEKELKFFSEYGMCELASQAWSLNSNHDGTFVANETLIPFAIDLQKYKTLSNSKPAFLGFIDTINVESYGAIITEDLGFIISSKKRTFKLLGRAPDASLKGCSLNLKNFEFRLRAKSDRVIQPTLKQNCNLHRQPCQQSLKSVFNIWKNLNKKIWNTYSISDFKESFSSLKNFSKVKNSNFSYKNILLIAAANTPISFVYPLIYCAMNGAKSFTLKIPSLRLNDPLSESIRLQIIDLFQNLSSYFPDTKFFISSSKSLEDIFEKYDCVFVFGTNETLQILKAHCTSKVQFFGFGDIKNAFVVNTLHHTPKFLAKLCSVWDGRGCLTPVCLFADEKNGFCKEFLISFFESLTDIMEKRLKSLKKSHEPVAQCISFHDHNALWMQAQLKKIFDSKSKLETAISIGNAVAGMREERRVYKREAHTQATSNDAVSFPMSILRSKWVTIIDLSTFTPTQIAEISIDFSLAGSGFVFILPMAMKNQCEQSILSFKPIFPTFSEFLKYM